MMGTILQPLISGIAMGFTCALVTIEYILIWNLIGLLNFSYDEIIAMGAYIFAATFTIRFNMNKPLAIVLTFMLMGILGFVAVSRILNLLRHIRPNIFAVMGTVMLGGTPAEAIRLIHGPVPFTIENWFSGTIKIGTPMVTETNVIICVVAILIVAVFQLFMNFTKIGKAIRCVAQDKKAAALMNINVTQNICVATAVSSVVCSVIGTPIIPLFNTSTIMIASTGLKGFSAGVIEGFGYLPEAILGGLFIGAVENLAVVILPVVHKDIVSFVLLIVFLLVHPNGFLGKKA